MAGPPEALLCRIEEIADGASRGFDPAQTGRDTMFIVRQGGQVFGWRNACPHHDGARMGWRKDAYLSGDGAQIQCAAHGALFAIETGVCTLGPCLGQRLTPVALRLVNGAVYLDEVGRLSAGN